VNFARGSSPAAMSTTFRQTVHLSFRAIVLELQQLRERIVCFVDAILDLSLPLRTIHMDKNQTSAAAKDTGRSY
jgi:hypothetical protein